MRQTTLYSLSLELMATWRVSRQTLRSEGRGLKSNKRWSKISKRVHSRKLCACFGLVMFSWLSLSLGHSPQIPHKHSGLPEINEIYIDIYVCYMYIKKNVRWTYLKQSVKAKKRKQKKCGCEKFKWKCLSEELDIFVAQGLRSTWHKYMHQKHK